jgi:nitrous oxide reductase accessory protein NosL
MEGSMKIKLLAILFISFLLASCASENTQSESTNIPQMIEGLINKVID